MTPNKIHLEIGAQSETMMVTDTTPLLSSAEASLGQVIDEGISRSLKTSGSRR
jgi:hypothetical protein